MTKNQRGERRVTAKVTWFGQYHWTVRLTRRTDGTFLYDGLWNGAKEHTTFATVRLGFANYPQVDRDLTGPQWDTLISLLQKLGAYNPIGA